MVDEIVGVVCRGLTLRCIGRPKSAQLLGSRERNQRYPQGGPSPHFHWSARLHEEFLLCCEAYVAGRDINEGERRSRE
jgi:hypothetical protein